MPDFTDFLAPSVKRVIVWLHFLFHPLEGVTRLFDEMKHKISWEPLLEIWVPAMVVTYFVSATAYNFVGISWNNAAFYGSCLLIQIAQPFIFAFILDRFLRLGNLNSNFQQTLAICTIVVVYAPLVTLVSAYLDVKIIFLMKDIKHQNLGFHDTFIQLFAVLWNNAKAASVPVQLMVYFAGMIAFLALGTCAECITQLYSNPRWPTYRTVALSILVALLLSYLVLVPLTFFATYSFIP